MEIKILGTGCPNCRRLEAIVKDVVRESGVSADVREVTDIAEIMGYGVMHTPGLVIDGEVKSVGRIPPKQEIAAWIVQAAMA